jgi:hypothetical protein
MPYHEKWNDRHQVVFKETVNGHKSDGSKRVFKKGTTYIVTSYERGQNGGVTYRFADGSWFYSYNGRVSKYFKYTDGYKDFLHRKYEIEDQQSKYKLDRAGNLFETDPKKRKAIEERYKKNMKGSYDNVKKLDAEYKRQVAKQKEAEKRRAENAAKEGTSLDYSGDGSGTDSSTGKPMDALTKKTIDRILMESGNYKRGIVNGREVLLKDENGNYILETENWKKYAGDSNNLHKSRHGGNVTRMMKNMDGIHGIPYGFLKSADPPVSGNIGRVYKENILDNAPVLLLTPGVPKFMDEFDADTRADVLTAIGGEKSNAILDQIVGEESGMYYTFEHRFDEYYTYVNTILNAMANLLGIGDRLYNGRPLATFKWQHFSGASGYKGLITSRQIVPFYVDAQSQASESFSNVTGESALAENVNNVQAFAREIQFVLGGAGSAKFKEILEGGVNNALSGLSSALQKFDRIIPTRVLNKLIGGFGTLVNGGKIVFPEIWQGSEFGKSQEITMRFSAPSGDPFTVYTELLVPTVHALCMVAPRQMGKNGYQSPYVVRAWYKSMFSSDLAIIESMQITRGDKGKWTKDGLPLSLEITMTIKDLYKMLSITKRDGALGTDLVQNPLLLSYISNLCGVNSFKPDILRTYDLYKTAIMNIPSDIINRIFDGALAGATNMLNLDRPGFLTTMTGMGLNSLVNNFKPKKSGNTDVPVLPNGFMGLSRNSGETDQEYAERVARALNKHENQSSYDAMTKSLNNRINMLHARGAKYGVKKIKLMTPDEFTQAYPNATNGAYASYIDSEMTKYHKRVINAEKHVNKYDPDKDSEYVAYTNKQNTILEKTLRELRAEEKKKKAEAEKAKKKAEEDLKKYNPKEYARLQAERLAKAEKQKQEEAAKKKAEADKKRKQKEAEAAKKRKQILNKKKK